MRWKESKLEELFFQSVFNELISKTGAPETEGYGKLPFIMLFRLKVLSTTVTFSLRRLLGLVLIGMGALCAMMKYTIIPTIRTERKYFHSFDPPTAGDWRKMHSSLLDNESLSCVLAFAGTLSGEEELFGMNDRLLIMVVR